MSATPTPYDRQANFVTDAQGNANITVSQIATKLDSEFDAINVSLDQTQSRLGEIQRDDGALKNSIVTASALTVDLRNKLVSGDNAYRGIWQSGITYFPGDVAYKDLSLYYCQVQHTAVDFTADLNGGNWSIAVANTISDTSDPNSYVPLTRWSLAPNGSATVFTITGTTVTNSAAYLVTIDGVLQDPASYTITTNTITFSEAPPSGSAVIVVGIAYAKGVLANAINTAAIVDGAVTTSKIASGAITSDLIADGAVGTADLANGAVTPAKLSTGGPSWDTSGNLTTNGNLTANGNVGIGTSSPNKLGIAKAETINAPSGQYCGYEISNADAITGGLVGSNTETRLVARGASNPLTIEVNTLERLRIDSSGNVGIGTSSPSVKLDVAGDAKATNFSVNTGGTEYGPYIVLVNTGVSGGRAWSLISSGPSNGSGVGNLEIFSNTSGGKIVTFGNPITSCPTTAKAWVNFNGNAIGTDYTTGNTITYAVSGSVTNVTITRASHTIGAGWFVTVSGVTGATGVNGTYKVTVVTGTTITYQVPSVVTGTVGGTAVVRPSIINGTPYNVSSITKNGTGSYTINFATALGDTSYSLSGSASNSTQMGQIFQSDGSSRTTSSCALATSYVNNTAGGGAPTDYTLINVTIFGN
jgi:hypothetical protein